MLPDPTLTQPYVFTLIPGQVRCVGRKFFEIHIFPDKVNKKEIVTYFLCLVPWALFMLAGHFSLPITSDSHLPAIYNSAGACRGF